MADSVLLIGSGGREHALSWKLAQSTNIKHIYVTPGNAGTHSGNNKVSNISLDVKDHAGIKNWCLSNNIKLVVVGPEDPLANGISDDLTSAGIKCFGPSKKAAQIEASKAYAKSFMERHNIPTARWRAFMEPEAAKEHILRAPYKALVVKASGLAAGKGVIVASTKEEAVKAIDEMLKNKSLGMAGETVVVEELLEGEEVSVLCFTDGANIAVMPPAQDHKRLLDGDEGPNTGGMGAYCPCPQVPEALLMDIKKNILQKTVDGMKAEGIPYIGVLYAGVMITSEGPKVLEFNCRFGDPETQAILPVLSSDLYSTMLACVDGNLKNIALKWKQNHYSLGIVLVSKGYPGSYPKGKPISGLEKFKDENLLVFHAGTSIQGNNIVTSGGRVLAVVAQADNLHTALARAQEGAVNIQYEGAFFRKDIAHRAIKRLKSGIGLTYKGCGVDITAADELVHKIRELARKTNRSGNLGSIGGFGGLFDLKAAGYKDPLLVSGTDGVGTKLKVAHMCNKHDTVGIDLVAMCVNDILTQGAEPLFFLDYYACGKLDPSEFKEVITGISEGCSQAKCSLIGGETAEMPGMYAHGDYDLAGFAVGAVERSQVLPRINDIKESDVLIGLPSSGVHSNGFSLIRKLLESQEIHHSSIAPFDPTKTIGDVLLTPTKIYVEAMLPALHKGLIKAAAHITGGGLTENIPRVLPSTCSVELDASQWEVPEVLSWIASRGRVSEQEMHQTFNCGLGMVLIVSKEDKEEIMNILKKADNPKVIGHVTSLSDDKPRVLIKNYRHPPPAALKPKKRIGVLISGSGTNLQSLIDHTLDSSKQSQAEIVLVISNIPDVEGLRRAERALIPTKVLSHKGFKSRVEFDMAVDKLLVEAGVEIVCLAGFMRIVSAEFVQKWTGRLLNIHPALLPAFKGMNAHRQVLEMGARITGCTVHFVETEVDAGAIIQQEAVRVEIGDTEHTLQERVKKLEHMIYPEALELLARNKVSRGNDGKLIWNM